MDPQNIPPPQPRSPFPLSLIFVYLFLLLIVGVGGYYLGKNQTQQQNPSIVPTTISSPSPTSFIPSPEPTSTAYKCPQTDYVDCMPVVGDGIKFECTQQYLNWAKLNCPTFKGATY